MHISYFSIFNLRIPITKSIIWNVLIKLTGDTNHETYELTGKIS